MGLARQISKKASNHLYTGRCEKNKRTPHYRVRTGAALCPQDTMLKIWESKDGATKKTIFEQAHWAEMSSALHLGGKEGYHEMSMTRMVFFPALTVTGDELRKSIC